MEVVEAERAASPGKFVEVIEQQCEQLTLTNSQLILEDEDEDEDAMENSYAMENS